MEEQRFLVDTAMHLHWRASARARAGGCDAATPTSVSSRTRFPKTEAQIVTAVGGPGRSYSQ